MSAVIMDGKALAKKVKEEVRAAAARMERRPGLAVILVGDDPASQVYADGKKRDCAQCGIYSEEYILPAETGQEELMLLIETLNGRSDIDGILIQLPLPAHLNERAVLSVVRPDKDVDCFHPFNVGDVYKRQAQSFAALVEDSDRERACQAVSAALERLYLPQAGVVKLFDPPFQDRGPDPGYIKGYLPGVRENGGQYTHGAVWLALACLRLGRTEDGLELLRALLPERRRTQIYQAEPYVLAADVYAAPGHLGRGGWSWYTGAAGWYYRTAVEELLGLKVREGRLFVEPHLPEDWPGWTGEWELDRGRLSIQVSRGRELSVRLDGREIRDGVPLRELTGDHRLEVTAVPGNGKLCFSAKDVV